MGLMSKVQSQSFEPAFDKICFVPTEELSQINY